MQLLSEEERTHSALHVLKGAAQKVLGVRLTAGVYVQGSHGRLTVQLDRKPSQEELSQVEEAANVKVLEDVPIEELEMSRSEAETRWGDSIYDLFPLPASFTRLKILHIPGWNVNACNKTHVRTTGKIGKIKIANTRYRPARQLLEFSFDVQMNG